MPFYFIDATDLTVYVTDLAGVTTTLPNGTYTVTGAGSQSGGTITTAAAVPITSSVVIARNVPATQLTSYTTGDRLPAATIEKSLDKLTMLAQQGQRSINTRSDEAALSIKSYIDTEVSNLAIYGSTTPMTRWAYTGDGTTVAFAVTGSNVSQATSYLVTLDGVTQDPASYTALGGALTFSEAPPSGVRIVIVCLGYQRASTGASDYSVTATGSTTARTLANRFADVVNVKDFGAIGDGTADDTAAFVAVINANSKLILIPRGVYYVPNPEGIYSTNNISTLWLSAGARLTTTSGGAGVPFSGIFYGEIMPQDFGPIAVANNNLPNQAGENAGLKVVTGQFPTASPASGDRVAGTFAVDNVNKTTAGGGIWGLNVQAAQSPINGDCSPATDSLTRAVEFEVAKVLGGANPDPWSGAAPCRANGIEIVGMNGSVYQPTAALTTWANDSTGSKWWQIGAAFSRITKWGVLFKKKSVWSRGYRQRIRGRGKCWCINTR